MGAVDSILGWHGARSLAPTWCSTTSSFRARLKPFGPCVRVGPLPRGGQEAQWLHSSYVHGLCPFLYVHMPTHTRLRAQQRQFTCKCVGASLSIRSVFLATCYFTSGQGRWREAPGGKQTGNEDMARAGAPAAALYLFGHGLHVVRGEGHPVGVFALLCHDGAVLNGPAAIGASSNKLPDEAACRFPSRRGIRGFQRQGGLPFSLLRL